MILRCFLLSLFLLPLLSAAQSTNNPRDTISYLQVDTKDGNRYIGKVRELNVERVVLEIDSTEIVTIDPLNIKRATVVSPVKSRKGKYWLENGQASRYLFGPSGYGLTGGTGYYQNVDFFANQIAYGFTNHISVSAGVMPLWFLHDPLTNYWIMPKFSIPIVREKVAVSGGIFYGLSKTRVGASHPYEAEMFLGYGVLTFGNRDRNVSLGTGYGAVNGVRMNKPSLAFSYLFRMGQVLYLVSENYVIPTHGGHGMGGVMSSGCRLVMQRATLELGIATYLSLEEYYYLPWVGFVVPFGRKPG